MDVTFQKDLNPSSFSYLLFIKMNAGNLIKYLWNWQN